MLDNWGRWLGSCGRIRPRSRKSFVCCAALQVDLGAIVQSSTILTKRLSSRHEKSCFKQRMRIRDEPSGGSRQTVHSRGKSENVWQTRLRGAQASGLRIKKVHYGIPGRLQTVAAFLIESGAALPVLDRSSVGPVIGSTSGCSTDLCVPCASPGWFHHLFSAATRAFQPSGLRLVRTSNASRQRSPDSSALRRGGAVVRAPPGCFCPDGSVSRSSGPSGRYRTTVDPFTVEQKCADRSSAGRKAAHSGLRSSCAAGARRAVSAAK